MSEYQKGTEPMTGKKVTPKRIVAACLSGLIPFAIIALGILLLLGGAIFNLTIFVGYFFVPGLILGLILALVFSRNLRWVKISLIVLLLGFLVFFFIKLAELGYHELIHHYENDQIAPVYAEVTEGFSCMPKLSEIGQTQSIDYYDYFSTFLIYFTCDADALICKYSEEDYKTQKALMEERYIFQTEPMGWGDEICEPETVLDGYTFRALDVDGAYENELYYPKKLMFVATNDNLREIVYLSFYDGDLDYIDSLPKFLLDECGWEHMN